MEVNVKKSKGRASRKSGSSRVSSKHQITIPKGAFSEAGLREGDVVQVSAQGPGRIMVERMEDLLDSFVGTLSTKGSLGRAVRKLRAEWD